MDKREYLRSLGFEVGERGRFSAEMLEALRSFEGEETQNKVVGHKTIARAIQKPMRQETRYMVVLNDGTKIEIGECGECKERILYCACFAGPKPPAYLDNEWNNWYPVTSKMGA